MKRCHVTRDTYASRSEHKRAGKALRQQVSRSTHGALAPHDDRPDPIGLLQAQDMGRLEYLLPIKYGRMAESPFWRYND
jgi:hypothetical protein